jgi:hypothetical protein
MASLFDDVRRTDPSPAAGGEDSFAFLNRVGSSYWAEVRRILDEWYSRYPAEERPALRRSFRSPLPGQHWASWWELYLHELFIRLGYRVTIHPALPDSPKSPDFELRRDAARLYVEATVLFSGVTTSDRFPPWLFDAINSVDNQSFCVRVVEIAQAGTQRLKDREIAQPLQEWLNEHDPDDVRTRAQHGYGYPQLSLHRRDWEIVFEAWPVAPGSGEKPHRVFGAGPIQAGWANDSDQLKSKLKAKAGRYGRPDVPLVTAVLVNSITMKRLDIEQALFGREAMLVPPNGAGAPQWVRQRNGFWVRADGPQNQRVSAALTAVNLHPGNASRVTPEVWLNPWANHPLGESWPFPEVTANDSGQISYRAASPDMPALLGVPPDWPGGEPFPPHSEGPIRPPD